MATFESLRSDLDVIDDALAMLREENRALAAGARPSSTKLEHLLAFLESTAHGSHPRDVALLMARDAEQDARAGRMLLAVLRETASRLNDPEAPARRQFFHAARAYLTIRKAHHEDERRSLAEIESVSQLRVAASATHEPVALVG